MCNSAIVCTSAGEQASEQETERERVRDVRLHIRSRIVRLTPRLRPPLWGVACACNACTYCMRSAYKCQVWQPIWPLNKTPCSLGSARRLLRLRASGATKYLDFFFFCSAGRPEAAQSGAITGSLSPLIQPEQKIQRPVQQRWASAPEETTSSPSSGRMLSLKSIWQRDHGSKQPHLYGTAS